MADLLIAPGAVELHFFALYDLGLRISAPKAGQDSPPSSANDAFETRLVKGSMLSRNLFSDDFPTRLVREHIHGKPTAVTTSAPLMMDNHPFTYGHRPCGSSHTIDSHAFLECNLFYNGMIAVVLRFSNLEPIPAEALPELVKRPEFAGGPGGTSYMPGAAVQAAWTAFSEIEPKLARFLTKMGYEGLSVSVPGEKPIRFYAGSEEVPKDNEHFERLLVPSRPYVGVVVDAKQHSTPYAREHLERVAIATARTTPELFYRFDDPSEYIRARNTYHPGPSIVLIGRRGWSCIKCEDREPVLFSLGVVESTLFAIQALHASVVATKRFFKQIRKDGSEASRALNETLSRIAALDKEFMFRALFTSNSTRIIHEFTEFLARARLVTPCDDESALLNAYMRSHTGIASVTRIKSLIAYDDVVDATRRTMTTYGAFLQSASQYWQTFNARVGQQRLLLGVLGFLGVLLLRAIKGFDWIASYLGLP